MNFSIYKEKSQGSADFVRGQHVAFEPKESRSTHGVPQVRCPARAVKELEKSFRQLALK